MTAVAFASAGAGGVAAADEPARGPGAGGGVRGTITLLDDGGARADYRQKWAVVVGIDAYPGGASGLEPLLYAGNDARELRETLVAEFGYADDHVRFLSDAAATREGVREAFEGWLAGRGVDPDDSLLVFFSGHGLIGAGGREGYLATVDSRADDPAGTCLSVSWLRDTLGKLPCRHKLVILDSCYSGALFERRPVAEPPPAPARVAAADAPAARGQRGPGRVAAAGDNLGYYLNRPAFWGISAGRYTPVADGLGQQRHSVFTSALLQALRDRADSDRPDHAFTFRQLAARVEAGVANALNSRQVPDWGRLGPGDGDFVFRETAERLTPGERSRQRQALIAVDRSLEEWAAGRHGVATHRLLQAHRLAPGRGPMRAGIRNLLADRLGRLEVAVRHEGAVLALAFSPDGTRLATAGFDKAARLWDADTGRPIGGPLRHGDQVLAVAFSPDGRILATGGGVMDKTVRLWGAADGRPLRPPLKAQTHVSLLAFSPDGRRLSAGGYTAEVRAWSVPGGEPLGPREEARPAQGLNPFGGGEAVTRVNGPMAFAPGGSTYYGTGQIREVGSSAAGRPLGADFGQAFAVGFSRDGRTVVLGGKSRESEGGGQAELFDAETGRALGRPVQTGRPVLLVEFSPHGKSVALVSDNDVLLVDPKDGHALAPPLRHPEPVLAVDYSPDGRLLLTGGQDGLARLWDADTGRPYGEPMRHDAEVLAVAFSPDGRRFATAGADGVARVWGPNARPEPLGVTLRTLWPEVPASPSPESAPAPRRDGPGAVLAVTPDGARFLSDDRVWDAATVKPVGGPLGLAPLRYPGYALSRDGKTVSLSGIDARSNSLLRFHDAAGGRVFAEYERGSAVGFPIAFLPDGKDALDVRVSGRLDFYAADKQKEWSKAFDGVNGSFLAFNPAGNRLATAEEGGARVQIRNVAGKAAHGGLTHPGAVKVAAFGGDGARIATAVGERVWVWEAATGKPVGGPFTQAAEVTALALDGAGALAVVGCADGTVGLWDVAAGAPRGGAFRMDDRVTAVGFHADGRRAFALDGRLLRFDTADGRPAGDPVGDPPSERVVVGPGGRLRAESRGWSVRLRDGSDGRLRHGPLHHDVRVESLVFSPDGSALAVGGFASVRLWDVESGRPRGGLLRAAGRGVSRAPVFSPDGASVLVHGLGAAALFDAATGAPRGGPLAHAAPAPGDYQKGVQGFRFSADGKALLLRFNDRSARIWDVATGTPRGLEIRVRPPAAHTSLVTMIMFQFDGQTQGIDTFTGRPRGERAAPALKVMPLLAEFTPDGRRVVVADGRVVQCRDAATGLVEGPEVVIDEPVRVLALSPDGRTLFVADAGGTVRGWDLATRRPLLRDLPHAHPVERLEVAADGTLTTAEEVPDGQLGLLALKNGKRPPPKARRWPSSGLALPDDLDRFEPALTARTGLRLDELSEPAPVSYADWESAWRDAAAGSASDGSAAETAAWDAAVVELCEAEGRWYAVKFHLDRVIRGANARDPELVLRRAFAAAELGLWDEAADGFSEAARLRPDAPRSKILLGFAQLARRDLDAYRATCRALLLALEGEPDSRIVMLYVRLAAAAPDTLPDPLRLDALVRRADVRNLGTWDLELARSWVSLRAGRENEVAKRSQGRDQSGILDEVRLWDALLAAAAEDQLGHAKEARLARDRAASIVTRLPRLPWYDRVVVAFIQDQVAKPPGGAPK